VPFAEPSSLIISEGRKGVYFNRSGVSQVTHFGFRAIFLLGVVFSDTSATECDSAMHFIGKQVHSTGTQICWMWFLARLDNFNWTDSDVLHCIVPDGITYTHNRQDLVRGPVRETRYINATHCRRRRVQVPPKYCQSDLDDQIGFRIFRHSTFGTPCILAVRRPFPRLTSLTCPFVV
jgi:hypothetical protein